MECELGISKPYDNLNKIKQIGVGFKFNPNYLFIKLKQLKEQVFRKIIEQHQKWICREEGGSQADLRQVRIENEQHLNLDLSDALCNDTVFYGSDLSGAKFKNTNLRFSDFENANLEKADFSGADLTFANFKNANLKDACFSGATLSKCHFENTTLSWYDNTLVSEILWQAAKNDFEKQMVAAFVGRKNAWCWNEYQKIPSKYRLWMLKYFRNLVKPDDNAPPFFKTRELRLKKQNENYDGIRK